MPPPPIRVPTAGCSIGGAQQTCSAAGDAVQQQKQQSWANKFISRVWPINKQQQQQGVEASEPPEDDLVCLSPLSQFFCNVANPPDIYANMTLEGHCSVEEIVGPMQHMADLHDRFRRRLVFSFGSWKAEVLDSFDVRSLMREVTLEGPDAQQAYHQYMGKLMSEEPLGTHGLPPWDVLCIHYACDPQRTDVLMRASHIIGDGQLFMKLIKQIMEPLDATARADYDASITHARAGTPGVGKQQHMRRSRPFAASRGGGGGVGGDSSSSSAGGSSTSLSTSTSSSGGSDGGAGGGANADAGLKQQPAHQPQDSSSQLSLRKKLPQQLKLQQEREQETIAAGQLQQQASTGQQRPQQHGRHQHHHKKLRGPQHWWRVFVGLLQWCWNQYTALIFSWIMLFWFADPVTAIKASEQQCSGPRRWGSVTIGLHDFHRTAKTLGHTLNTLAVACLAGGVRRYLLRHGQTPARRIRMCGMVDTRSMPGLLPGSMHGASNNFSFIGVPLYTGDISAVERLARVGRAMSWVRHSLVVPIAIRMPDVIQTLFRRPEASSKAILRALPLKTTVGFSNMKGPAGCWSLSGYRVSRIHNGVQPMAFGSFISLFSYHDSLTFTHTCFETKTKQPEVLLECILEEYHCLRKAASISSLTAGPAGAGAAGAGSVQLQQPDSPSGSDSSKIKAA